MIGEKEKSRRAHTENQYLRLLQLWRKSQAEAQRSRDLVKEIKFHINDVTAEIKKLRQLAENARKPELPPRDQPARTRPAMDKGSSIQLVAERMVHALGPQAYAHVYEQAEIAEFSGDRESAITWRDIAVAVAELSPSRDPVAE